MRGKMKFAHYEGFLVPRFLRAEAVASIDGINEERRRKGEAETRRKAEQLVEESHEKA